MSTDLPEVVDPWRVARERRIYMGVLPVTRLARLKSMLAAPDGRVDFKIEFGVEQTGRAFCAVHAAARVQLQCQRSLEQFWHRLEVASRLGMIESEADEVALPEGYEPLLVAQQVLRPADVLEDELILAVPLVPKDPEAMPLQAETVDERQKPFADLAERLQSEDK